MCGVPECDGAVRGRGLCNKHLLRLQRHGDPLLRKKAANGETCSKPCVAEGCSTTAKARGYCQAHFDRVRKYGDPTIKKKLANGEATPERKRENRTRAQRTYYATPHGIMRKRYATAKRRVLNGGKSVHISKDEFLALWNSSICSLCPEPLSDATKSIDHIVPLARGGSNDLDNMQMAHLLCNQRKNASMGART